MDGDPGRPDPARTSALVAAARERGLLLLQCGVRGNVIRFLPPLTIEEALLDEALKIIAESLAETVVVKTLA